MVINSELFCFVLFIRANWCLGAIVCFFILIFISSACTCKKFQKFNRQVDLEMNYFDYLDL